MRNVQSALATFGRNFARTFGYMAPRRAQYCVSMFVLCASQFASAYVLSEYLARLSGAFAGGVVDYIGDSPVYGLYLQIKHAGGLTSFYAHCSELCVQPGQTVAAGETVALSGATGNATGPHLHFEMKLNGTLLNPLYYIETE